jgi:hypothetical protein
VQERLWCDHELFRWVGHAASDGTLLHHVVGPPASLIGSELPVQFGSGPLSWIETFVTFCGMVGLQAMVLGRLGMKAPSSKSVCSILPIAICGPGLAGAPAFSCAW